MQFYSKWVPIVLAYITAFGLLVVGMITHSMYPLYIAIIGFTLWDVFWIICSAPDRNAQETLDSTTRSRTYMSYFLAVYGVALAYFLLHLTTSERNEILNILSNAGVPKLLLLLPFALQTIAMLFFPIKLGNENIPNSKNEGTLAGKKPTAANLAVLVVTVWVEKVTIFSFLYVVALLGNFIVHTTS